VGPRGFCLSIDDYLFGVGVNLRSEGALFDFFIFFFFFLFLFFLFVEFLFAEQSFISFQKITERGLAITFLLLLFP
jgi:hypothetical protein